MGSQLFRVTVRALWSALLLVAVASTQAADVVPPEIEQPGTQPSEVGNFEDPGRCDNCHAGYDDLNPENEPSTGWAGAAMGNAGRDPVFWATLAIAEQDFDGSGDLCIRCHSAGGWYADRSTPTDGSGLQASDDNGIDCDTCHTMTNPNDTEHQGEMNSPFIANCTPDANVPDKCTTTGSADEGFYGSGMLSLWNGSDKLGPYADAEARHQWMQSNFHRSVDFCGSCHDVSNPAVGDLAPGNGAQHGAPHVISSQDFNGGAPNLGGPVEQKAAFNNPPYAYGIVERTFSEYKASAFPTTLVSDYNTLPADLRAPGGSLDVTYNAAMLAGTGGNYEDGTPRYFSCQSCHMRPVEAKGCNKNGAPVRKDMPMHDQTGGNYWFANMVQYQDSKGQLRLGGGLSGNQILAMDLGQQRAVNHLQQAASLVVDGNALKVVNLTGHKLISGYPEGRRMWLNVKWYDASGALLREDGAYGPLVDGNGAPITVTNPANGQPVQVESIKDLNDPNMRIYDAHYAMTKEWADTLLAVGTSADLPLSFDRATGAVNYTLGQLAAQQAGSYHETFHFVLNNYVAKDTRIPPYGMRYDEAQKRNALPVPASQYGNPGAGGIYQYWDQLDLAALAPTGAASAQIDLLYQGTSWEYIQFLDRANTGQNAFLGQEGQNMLEAWINAEVPVAMEVAGDRKMVPPVVMASTTWGAPPSGNDNPVCSIDTPAGDVTINEGDSVNYTGTATDADGTIASYSWNFEGGSPASSSVEDPGSVTYATAGTYTTTFTATDDAGAACATASVQVTVNPVAGNQDPVCSIDTPAGDITINEGDSVNYTGTATDADGTIASYSWSFGGGSPASSSVEDPGSVSYAAAGTYTTTFSATDDAGAACAADSVQVTVNPVGGGPEAGVVSPMETGYYAGKGGNRTFTASSVFAQGDDVVIRATVVDSNGAPVEGAVVSIAISGPETATVSATSDATGLAEATWNTRAPKRNNPGTSPGSYTASVTDVTASGYTWNGVMTSASFDIQ